MSKEIESLLRLAALVLIFLVLMGVAIKRISNLEKHIKELENAPADTIKVLQIDTICIDKPVPVHHYIKQKDTAFIVLTDCKVDTIKQLVYLPREYMVYKDSTYRAVVSGVQPRLDSIEIYRPTITNTITKTITKTKKTRFGIGPQAGVSYDGKKVKPYIGIGVHYNLMSW